MTTSVSKPVMLVLTLCVDYLKARSSSFRELVKYVRARRPDLTNPRIAVKKALTHEDKFVRIGRAQYALQKPNNPQKPYQPKPIPQICAEYLGQYGNASLRELAFYVHVTRPELQNPYANVSSALGLDDQFVRIGPAQYALKNPKNPQQTYQPKPVVQICAEYLRRQGNAAFSEILSYVREGRPELKDPKSSVTHALGQRKFVRVGPAQYALQNPKFPQQAYQAKPVVQICTEYLREYRNVAGYELVEEVRTQRPDLKDPESSVYHALRQPRFVRTGPVEYALQNPRAPKQSYQPPTAVGHILAKYLRRHGNASFMELVHYVHVTRPNLKDPKGSTRQALLTHKKEFAQIARGLYVLRQDN